MPSDTLGRTRTTLPAAQRRHGCGRGHRNRRRGGDRGLELSPANEECPVGARHQRAPTTSLSFVHTARRSYRLGGLASCPERKRSPASRAAWRKEKS